MPRPGSPTSAPPTRPAWPTSADRHQLRLADAAAIERLTAQLIQARADADEQRAYAEAQAAEARTVTATLTAELGAARQRFEDERAHAETRLADQRTAYEARLADLRGQPRAAEGPARNPRRGKTSGETGRDGTGHENTDPEQG